MPAASTAILEFQPVSADGDFGLRCLDNSVVNITGVPRTAGKLVTQCKLTANVASANLSSSGLSGTGSSTAAALDASGNSLTAVGVTDSAVNTQHHVYHSAPATVVGNTTVTVTVWLARGSGLNNRYIRLACGNAPIGGLTIGFYSDIDLQAGTAGTVTAAGNGTGISISMIPEGRGYLVKMIGKVSSAIANPNVTVAACAVAGTTVYTGNTTQCFIYDHLATVATASLADTTFNVDTDTGWLAGDAVCVASTTRTASECEIYPLNANAGSSSFTSALYPFHGSVVSTHHGTSPIQAEIGLITRNVKIRSTSTTLMSYVYCTALSTVTASWAEFYYVGLNTTNKRGIEIDAGAVANAKSFTYCSIHDCDYSAFTCANNAASLNLMFANNVIWNSSGAIVFNLGATISNSDWILDNNLMMRSGGVGFNFTAATGVCTNNTVVGGGGNPAFSLNGTTMVLGTFDNNTGHSCGNTGLTMTVTVIGTINNFKAWRNGGSGVACNVSSFELTFNNLTLFGNTSASFGDLYVGPGSGLRVTGSSIIAGDTTFSSVHGIYIVNTVPITIDVSGVDMSGTTSIYAPHTTNDIFFSGSTAVYGTMNNCKFGAPLLLNSKSSWASNASIGFQKFNQTAGDHRTEMTCGQLRTDSAVYHTASPSTRMTPNNASNRLTSATANRGTQVAVASGDTVTASVWVRKDVLYFGSQPRLIVRSNPAVGITTDTVLAMCSDVTTGLQPATFNDTPSASIGVTNGGLTVTHGSLSNNVGTKSLLLLSTGKYYFEYTTGTITNTGAAVGGIFPTASDYSTYANSTSTSFANNCNIASNGVAGLGNLGTHVNGDVFKFAIDLDARLGWIRRNNGDWNANASANPATGAFGVAIVPSIQLTPFIRFNSTCAATDNLTANFGASTFSGTVPSGFNAGWGMVNGPGTATWVQLSGTTIAATDDGVMEFVVDCDGSGFINVDDWSFA